MSYHCNHVQIGHGDKFRVGSSEYFLCGDKITRHDKTNEKGLLF